VGEIDRPASALSGQRKLLRMPASDVRRLEYEGCQLAYHVYGSGPPVLFIQGVGVHGRGWAPQIEELRSRFTCVCFDNRGMGESQPAARPISVAQMAADALALMDHERWASAHVVGHSLGGPIALQLALAHPKRVRSLALLCTVARGADATRLSWQMLSIGIRSRIGPRPSRRQAFMEIVMPPGSVAESERDRLASELAELFGHDLADQPAISMQQLRALHRFDRTADLSRLAAIPTLVVSAGHDPIAPPRFGRGLAAAIQGASFVEFDDAAHGLPIQHAARVNALLGEHFAAAESSRRTTLGVEAS
jgi:pimeloyl-ACP methyl ester carboxylesterase